MTAERPTLANFTYLSAGIANKMHRMMYDYGPGNGTLLGLPFDQLVEHGPGHEFKWEGCAKPASVIELANTGPFSVVVLSVGQAIKYQHDIEIPLLMKLDGHFTTGKVNDANYPRHTMFGTVEEAVQAGADCVGLSFYLGSQQTGEDVERIGKIREEAHQAELPLVVWCYPRGPLPGTTKADSLLWCHYAVSAGESLGADIIKTKFPAVVPPKQRDAYEDFILNEYAPRLPEVVHYLDLEPTREQLEEYQANLAEGEKPNYDSLLTKEQHIERAKIVTGAGTRTVVIYSGGPRITGDAKAALTESTEIIMDAGGEGRIIGRNFWGVPIPDALELANAVADVMKRNKYARE